MNRKTFIDQTSSFSDEIRSKLQSKSRGMPLVLTRDRPGATKSRRMSKSRYRVALAVLAALWVVALGLSDLARGIHLLAEPHVICSEHGELIEGAISSGTVAAAGARPQSSALPAPCSAIGHHAHCAIAAKPANVMWTAVPIRLPVGTIEIPRSYTAVDFESRTVPQRPILFVAPKQSPPV